MAHDVEKLNLKLGRKTDEASLDPIPRALGRKGWCPSFYGFDLWNAYEVSFLLPGGKPVVYHMQARYDANTPYMVESKSFKLYLNQFNNQIFNDIRQFEEVLSKDLSACVDGEVTFQFFEPDQSPAPKPLPGTSLDGLDYQKGGGEGAELLKVLDQVGGFHWRSHLLRTNCPVTNQPDWGAVVVKGFGPKAPQPESLLAYVISYRNHQGFHESCCEMIYRDLADLLKPETLEVACLYTRRGGLDINPYRFSQPRRDLWTAPAWRQ